MLQTAEKCSCGCDEHVLSIACQVTLCDKDLKTAEFMAGEKSSNKILNLDPTTIEYDGFIAVVNTAMKSVIGTEIAVVCRMKRLAVCLFCLEPYHVTKSLLFRTATKSFPSSTSKLLQRDSFFCFESSFKQAKKELHHLLDGLLVLAERAFDAAAQMSAQEPMLEPGAHGELRESASLRVDDRCDVARKNAGLMAAQQHALRAQHRTAGEALSNCVIGKMLDTLCQRIRTSYLPADPRVAGRHCVARRTSRLRLCPLADWRVKWWCWRLRCWRLRWLRR